MLSILTAACASWLGWFISLVASPVMGPAGLQDWYVDASAADCASASGTASAPFCTITEAVEVASAADTVRIAPGRYRENLVVDMDLSLIGTQGLDVTVVDGGGLGSVLRIETGASVEVTGLTMTDGFSASRGAGIANHGDCLVLRNSSVSGNVSSADVARATVYNALGSRMRVYASSVNRNRVLGYSSVGAGIGNFGDMRLVDTEIVGNYLRAYFPVLGSAIYNRGTLDVLRCTLTDNVALYPTGVLHNQGGQVRVDSSILWGNRWVRYPGRASITNASGGTVQASYSDIEFGWPGVGNVELDPLFNDTLAGDYRLAWPSPSIDEGTPNTSPAGLDRAGNPRLLDGDLDRELRVDMGAHEFGNLSLEVTGEPTSGGSVTVTTLVGADLCVWLAVGTPSSPQLLAPWGSVFFDLSAAPRVLAFGTGSQSQTFALPPSLPGPPTVLLQAIGLSLGSPPRPGNVSNPIQLRFQ